MKEFKSFEEYLINKIINIFYLVRTRKYKDARDIQKLTTYNLALIEFDVSDFMFNHANAQFDLMALLMCGHIHFDKEVFDFNLYLDKSEKDTLIETIYFLSLSTLIAYEFKETNNYYKAIRNNEENAKYLLEDIKDIIPNYIDEDYDVPSDVLNYLSKEGKEFAQIIINSGVLVK